MSGRVGGDVAVWFGGSTSRQLKAKLLVRALEPELVWLEHAPYRPRTV